jgi:uncharacterized membrane protein YcaP (DUF421 family)
MFFSSWSALLRIWILGAAAYLALVAILRISGKRTLSKMNAFDLVVTVALGSALATTLLSRDTALAEGVAAFALLALLQFAVSRSVMRWPAVERIAKSEPRLLFRGGVLLEGACHSERVTRSEILSAIRTAGHGDPSRVGAVILETDGSFSVIGEDPTPQVLEGVRAAPEA